MDGEEVARADRHQPKQGWGNPFIGTPTYCNPKPAKLPIDREDMDPNCAVNRGQTLAYCAGRIGREEI